MEICKKTLGAEKLSRERRAYQRLFQQIILSSGDELTAARVGYCTQLLQITVPEESENTDSPSTIGHERATYGTHSCNRGDAQSVAASGFKEPLVSSTEGPPTICCRPLDLPHKMCAEGFYQTSSGLGLSTPAGRGAQQMFPCSHKGDLTSCLANGVSREKLSCIHTRNILRYMVGCIGKQAAAAASPTAASEKQVYANIHTHTET